MGGLPSRPPNRPSNPAEPDACDHGGMDAVIPYVLALVPTIGVGTLFYYVIKNILEGDRRERLAQSKWEAQQDAEEESRKRS